MVISKKHYSPTCNIVPYGTIFRQGQNFNYRDQVITRNGRCDVDIKRTIAQGNAAFHNMTHILTNKNISLEMRKTNTVSQHVHITICLLILDIKYTHTTLSTRTPPTSATLPRLLHWQLFHTIHSSVSQILCTWIYRLGLNALLFVALIELTITSVFAVFTLNPFFSKDLCRFLTSPSCSFAEFTSASPFSIQVCYIADHTYYNSRSTKHWIL